MQFVSGRRVVSSLILLDSFLSTDRHSLCADNRLQDHQPQEVAPLSFPSPCREGWGRAKKRRKLPASFRVLSPFPFRSSCGGHSAMQMSSSVIDRNFVTSLPVARSRHLYSFFAVAVCDCMFDVCATKVVT